MLFSDFFYDIKQDMWQYLSNSSKPIVLYGMGDGADKIMSVMNEKNIPLSGIFASDGFVPKKEKLFNGHRIQSYGELKEKFSDMIVLVAFGTKLPNVLDNIKNIASECELYAPDVPVFGDGILDIEYFNSNFKRLENVYNRLSDETSKKAYVCALKYRLSGKIDYLSECETTIDESYKNILRPKENVTYVDVGAYNGDTVREFKHYSGNNITVHAFEPDTKNFKKLSLYRENSEIRDFSIYNCAAWDKDEQIEFYSRSGRNSAGTTSHEGAKKTTINGVRVDSVCTYADFVKIDAEGSDKKAVCGMKNLISDHSPALCIAAYHRTEDYFDIPESVLDINPDYNIYFRHFPHVPCWDTNFYFVRKEK